MKKRIYYHDTDCGGVVYYGNYLKYLEEARTEYMEQRGLSVKQLMDMGILFVVYRQEVDYKFPAFYGDVLDIETKVLSMSEIKTEFEYTIRNQDGRITTRAKTVMVSVNRNFESQSVPKELRDKMLQPAAVY
ncbi:MAG: thioesterase family protein [Elusimicrobiales bacterium]|nr:thioesterase family protein [Elusimicrobiales bacterium]